MKLKSVKLKNVRYNWATIYVGIEEGYFDGKVLTDYAIELMEKGEDNDFINELAWVISKDKLPEVMSNIKINYLPEIDETKFEWSFENEKLRYVFLSNLKNESKDNQELLNEIAQFYDNHNYPEDMIPFINYMPQDSPSNENDLLKKFNEFLKIEKEKSLG
ncbi:DUF2247 domain-containing protein [Carnobacterium maltaromaticum]|uniref:DUF2247 family protein n=1 Tax=Carnobacterium maltaromaticum TaxID=2751 RepID=UPI000704A354|nr:DUF2247 family protein [Carnobacterium maltaromaticum]KRN84688.1 hypothetical protein IV75_GL000219 [Carnobacterium maltaromaticum]MDT1945917.1 DUF2247 family protein [Carnobacterium maltaromaticum]MDT2000421.1 DUF2247 family protein [Carnobacterium maltaromaticum]TFJ30265.1 DUF2247 domain-containing protein [Carnobacterium maltaromaticum]TFJ33725.1 DUF2247 domain-containing protein [Carnobacterium maltaromaticum]